MVNQTEEGGVGTNAASERNQGDKSETGPSQQRPKTIGHIAREHSERNLVMLSKFGQSPRIADSEIIRTNNTGDVLGVAHWAAQCLVNASALPDARSR